MFGGELGGAGPVACAVGSAALVGAEVVVRRNVADGNVERTVEADSLEGMRVRAGQTGQRQNQHGRHRQAKVLHRHR